MHPPTPAEPMPVAWQGKEEAVRMRSATTFIGVDAPVDDQQRRRIAQMNNNAMIVRLMFTINHLSRWLSPIHDPDRLERSAYRNEPSAKDLVIGMRDEEQRVFPKLHLIATRTKPDLDTLPPWQPDPRVRDADQQVPPIVLLASFRRLRLSTCSLLRSLPDDAWDLVGRSRREHNVTVRELAEGLVLHDYRYLRALDEALEQSGAREGLAKIQRAHLDELLKLSPGHLDL
jgi:hypothetical protein